MWDQAFLRDSEVIQRNSTAQFRRALMQLGPNIQRAWAEAVYAAKEGRGYRRTGALGKALNLRGTVSTAQVVIEPDNISFRFELKFSGAAVLSEHLKAQHSINMLPDKERRAVIAKIKDGEWMRAKIRRVGKGGKKFSIGIRVRQYPKDLGIVGSVWTQKHPYLIEYLSAGGNAPLVSSEWYRSLKGGTMPERLNRGQVIMERFLRYSGLGQIPFMNTIKSGRVDFTTPREKGMTLTSFQQILNDTKEKLQEAYEKMLVRLGEKK